MTEEDSQRICEMERLMRDGQPRDFATALATYNRLLSLVREHIAKRFEPLFNAELRSMPHHTYAEKKTVTHFANGSLRQLGLAIRDPVLNEPALLTADPGRDGHETWSRFRLKSGYSTGNERSTKSSKELWDFKLMPDSPRKEGLAIRHQRRSDHER